MLDGLQILELITLRHAGNQILMVTHNPQGHPSDDSILSLSEIIYEDPAFLITSTKIHGNDGRLERLSETIFHRHYLRGATELH